jgi:acetyltransferase-like isoleucine patch superfamily enzyme
MRPFRSHGTGQFSPQDFGRLGEGVVFEPGALVFHPENVEIGDNVYVGHYAILKGYYQGRMVIGSNTWIGQAVFFHAAGNITIGENVGIGPHVKILTSFHAEAGREVPILGAPIETAPVVVEADADVGIAAILLPGITVGRGAQVGAGAVVTHDVPPYAVVAGNPARVLRTRP